MSQLQSTILASANGLSVTAADLLRSLRLRGRLKPLLIEAVAEQVIARVAKAAGLTISVDELQRAADRFRRGCGLTSARDTESWLADQEMSIEDLGGRA